MIASRTVGRETEKACASSRSDGKRWPILYSPLAMPLFSTDARVVARTRDLPITWVGGCAPYVVAILKGADTAAVRRNIDTDRARLDDVRLAPGRYRVVLSDGANQRVEGSFEAVTELPALPADLAADRTDLGIIAQAIWLSDADGGRWRLDAFDRLRPLLRTGNALAGAIGDGILWSRPNDRPQR